MYKVKSIVGIIPNPMAGEDIRRLTAYGISYNNVQKAQLVREVVLGADAVGVDEIVFMPDFLGIGYHAVDRIADKISTEITFLDMRITYSAFDSTLAAKMMNEMGAGCIVVVGGDGTNRAVAKGCGDTPILPLAAGTNNVFPYMMEGTVAGMIAGYVAKRKPSKGLFKAKAVRVLRDDIPFDLALIDAVVCQHLFTGTKALWSIRNIRQIVATVGDPTRIGMSSIGALLSVVDRRDRKHGIYVKVGEDSDKCIMKVKAPIAPGIVTDVCIEEFRILKVGDRIPVEYVPSLVAVDGEREIDVNKGDEVELMLCDDGPLVVDVPVITREIVREGWLREGGIPIIPLEE